MPEGIYRISLVANGGQGGAGGGADGGTGGAPAQVLADSNVHPGDVLTVRVGQAGRVGGLPTVEQGAAEMVHTAEVAAGTLTG